MTLARAFLLSVSLTLATPLAADLEPDDVWSDWQANLNGFGLDVSGQEASDGDALVVRDARVEASFMDGAAQAGVDLGTLRFEPAAGGAVRIVLPPAMTAQTVVSVQGGPSETTLSTYGHEGLSIEVTGTPQDLVYTYAADAITVDSTTSTTVGSDTIATQGTRVSFDGVTGETRMTLADMRDMVTETAVEGGTYSIVFNQVPTGATANIDTTFEDVLLTGDNSFPLLLQQNFDLSTQVAEGLALTGRVEIGENRTEISTQTDQPLDAVLTAAAAGVDFELGRDGLAYDISKTDMTAQVATAMLPLPVEFGIEEAGFAIGFPVVPSDAPGDLGLGITFDGLTLSDTLWGLFDPTGGLPRDPARLVLDLTGKARLLVDLLNPPSPEQMSAPGFSPAALENLQINRLELSVVGASLTGEGEFTFTEPQAGSPLPRPDGRVDLELVGANGLLDTLVTIGLLPPDQVMGARLMMGLLGVPGDAPDTLTSTIEVNEQFHVIANGQRIQ